ncbi:MAG: hypothetical protein ACK4P3_07435 [Fimbriimonadaceae bacterium]
MNPDSTQSVDQMIAVSMELFFDMARASLGGSALPFESGGPESPRVDLAAARKAINAADALFQILEPELDEEDRSRVRSILSQLRIEVATKSDSSTLRDA